MEKVNKVRPVMWQKCVFEYAGTLETFYVKELYDDYFVVKCLDYFGAEVSIDYSHRIVNGTFEKNISFAFKNGKPVLNKPWYLFWKE